MGSGLICEGGLDAEDIGFARAEAKAKVVGAVRGFCAGWALARRRFLLVCRREWAECVWFCCPGYGGGGITRLVSAGSRRV